VNLLLIVHGLISPAPSNAGFTLVPSAKAGSISSTLSLPTAYAVG
jgi:hypothetical protein